VRACVRVCVSTRPRAALCVTRALRGGEVGRDGARMRTLRDLQNDGSDDDRHSDDEGQEYFAGGEKSCVAPLSDRQRHREIQKERVGGTD
jgi:hypothetical protein